MSAHDNRVNSSFHRMQNLQKLNSLLHIMHAEKAHPGLKRRHDARQAPWKPFPGLGAGTMADK
jgi:hypothetical protein